MYNANMREYCVCVQLNTYAFRFDILNVNDLRDDVCAYIDILRYRIFLPRQRQRQNYTHIYIIYICMSPLKLCSHTNSHRLNCSHRSGYLQSMQNGKVFECAYYFFLLNLFFILNSFFFV